MIPLKRPQPKLKSKTTPKALTKPKRTTEVKSNTGVIVREVDTSGGDPEIQDGDMRTTRNTTMSTVPANTGFCTVGLQLGATINMGDYNSARIDAFITRNVPDNDKSISQAIDQIGKKLQTEVSRQADLLSED